MADNVQEKAEEKRTLKLARIKPNTSDGLAEFRNLEETKKQAMYSNFNVSPGAHGGGGARKARLNCLCSPTTHAGSFRCRHHRVAALTRGGSVGSKLASLLASRSGRFSDSLKAQ